MVHQTAKNSHKVFLNIKMFLKLLRAYFDTFTPNLNMLARNMFLALFLLCFTTSHVAFFPFPHSYNAKQTWHVVYLSMIFIHAFSNTIYTLWQSSRRSRPKSKQLPLLSQHLAFLLLKALLSFMVICFLSLSFPFVFLCSESSFTWTQVLRFFLFIFFPEFSSLPAP